MFLHWNTELATVLETQTHGTACFYSAKRSLNYLVPEHNIRRKRNLVVWDKTWCTVCIFTAKLYNCVTSCARTQKKETHGSENSFLLVIFLCLLIRFIIKIRTMQHTQARMTHKAQGHDGQRINPICIDQQSLLETSKIPWKSVAMYIWRQS